MNVELDPQDLKRLEQLATASGKDVGEVLRELVHAVLTNGHRGGSSERSGAPEESFLDAALRLDAVGCIKGGPSDVSTHPKHMKGFGED